MVGKSLKDRRQNKAIEDLFDKADKNGNGRISVEEYVHIFSDHGIDLSPDEVGKVTTKQTNHLVRCCYTVFAGGTVCQ